MSDKGTEWGEPGQPVEGGEMPDRTSGKPIAPPRRKRRPAKKAPKKG